MANLIDLGGGCGAQLSSRSELAEPTSSKSVKHTLVWVVIYEAHASDPMRGP